MSEPWSEWLRTRELACLDSSFIWNGLAQLMGRLWLLPSLSHLFAGHRTLLQNILLTRWTCPVATFSSYCFSMFVESWGLSFLLCLHHLYGLSHTQSLAPPPPEDRVWLDPLLGTFQLWSVFILLSHLRFSPSKPYSFHLEVWVPQLAQKKTDFWSQRHLTECPFAGGTSLSFVIGKIG